MSLRVRDRIDDGRSQAPASPLTSRDVFVSEVAASVAQRYGTGTESFAFGLSGRWGEGKRSSWHSFVPNSHSKDLR